MERIGGENTGMPTSIRKVVVASFIGTTIEWYDYFIFVTAASLIFPDVFFPGFGETTGTILSYTTFAVGFVARPVGGVIFGHYGDRIGRKAMLVTTLLIMGIATFLVGCLPGYEAIGVLAPILLVALRLFQGLGLGGEWGGAVIMAVEHSPERSRGLNASWPQMGVPAGLVLGTGAFALISSLSGDALLTWGWRVPFLLSVILIAVGLFVRLSIYESPAFSLLAFYSLDHIATNLGLSENIGLIGVTIAALIELFTIPLFASLSDRVGRKPLLLVSSAFLGVWVFPFFWLLNTKSTALIVVAIVIGLALGHAAVYGVQASFYAELFGTRVRYSGASFSYQISGIFGGALAPIIATALYPTGGTLLISVYIAAVCTLSVVCYALADETYRKDIYEEEPAERRLVAEQQG